MNIQTFIKTFALSLFLASCGSSCNPDTVSSDTNSKEPSLVTWDECGYFQEDHMCNIKLTNHDGEEFELYDYIGSPIVIDFSTMWCGYCRISAEDVQAVQDEYGDRNFLWVTLLVDDTSGGDVSLDEVQLWSNTYGITTAPVLAADRSIIDLTAENGYPVTSWPMFMLIDQEMNIIWELKGWSQQLVLEAIEDNLEQ